MLPHANPWGQGIDIPGALVPAVGLRVGQGGIGNLAGDLAAARRPALRVRCATILVAEMVFRTI